MKKLLTLMMLLLCAITNVLATETTVTFLEANKNDAGNNFASMTNGDTQLVGNGLAKLIATNSVALSSSTNKTGYRCDDSRLYVVFKFDGNTTLTIKHNSNSTGARYMRLYSFSSDKALSGITSSDWKEKTQKSFTSTSTTSTWGGGQSSAVTTNDGKTTWNYTTKGCLTVTWENLPAGYYVLDGTGSEAYMYGFTANVSGTAAPSITPAESEVVKGQAITMASATDGAAIYYTINGTNPTSESTLYNGESKPTITENTTFKAIAIKDAVNSGITTKSYTVRNAAAPTPSEAAGAVAAGTEVELSSADGGTIYYTVDGTEPTNESTEYTGAITIDIAKTIKTVAYVNGYAGEVGTYAYIIAEKSTKTWDFSNWSEETQAGVRANAATTSAAGKWDDHEESGKKLLNDKVYANNGGVVTGGIMKYGDTIIPETKGLVFSTNNYLYDLAFNYGSATVSDKEYTYHGNKYMWLYGSGATITIPNVPANSTITIATESHNGSEARYVSLTGVAGITQTQGATSGNAAKVYQVCKWTIPAAGNIVVTPSKGLHVYYITIENTTPIEDVTVSAANYKSYNTTMPTDFSKTDGVQAFIVTEASASAVTLTEVTVVPANTPVILKTAGEYEIHGAAWAPVVSGNLLQISNGTVTGDGSTKYALANIDNKPGFYKVGNGITIPTSYLVISGDAKGYVPFADDVEEEQGTETNGIKAVSTTIESGIRYNLAGQKVGADYKGIVIVNGKKVITK